MFLENVKPRLYQQNVVDNVIKEGSSIIVLPTGLGKTIIALMIIDKFLEKNNNARILFLAPTKPLVEQHFETFVKLMPKIKTKMLTALVKKKDRKQLILDNRIIIGTPQTLANELNNLDKDIFDLIIFDECHRAVGNYDYVNIANHFKSTNIGLTASPGTTKTKIKEIMTNLKIENLEIKTEDDLDVSQYINQVNTYWVKVHLPQPLEKINELLKIFLNQQAIKIRRYGFALRNLFTQREILAIQARIFGMLKEKNKNPKLYQAISIVASMMKIEHAITLLETQGVNALKDYFDRLNEETSKASIKIKEDENIQKAKYILEGLNLLDLEHPKIAKLEEIILQELNTNPKQRIIVFNHYRDSVSNLETILNKNPLISATKFIGQAKKGEEKGFNQKKQKEIIEEFKSGKYNVLLATSIAEEGLDIPKVDTIIFYEPIPSDIRSIQRRGRTGRFKTGNVYILITENTRDESFFWASRNKEKHMNKALQSLSKKNTTFEKINKIIDIKKKEPIKKPKIVKQQILTNIFDKDIKKKTKISIFVDTRERRSKTYDELTKKDCDIIIKQLDIGDYQVGEETIIERKSANDFVESLLDGRLFKQAIKLSVFEKPVFLIEGNIDLVAKNRNINMAQIYGAMFSLIFEFKIPLFFSFNEYESADIIYFLAKREQLRKERPISLRKVKKTEDINLLQQYVIEGLPYIGPTLAIRLLEKFGSIKAIFNTSLERLQKIEGIGKKKAEKIFNLINQKYKK